MSNRAFAAAVAPGGDLTADCDLSSSSSGHTPPRRCWLLRIKILSNATVVRADHERGGARSYSERKAAAAGSAKGRKPLQGPAE